MGANGKKSRMAQSPIFSKRQVVSFQSTTPNAHIITTPTVADVHGAEKVSWFAIEVETAGGASIIHLGEAPINGRTENASGATAWTKLAEDTLQSGWMGARQEPMIVFCQGI